MPAPLGHAPYPGCEKGGRPPYSTERIEQEADLLLQWMDEDPGNIFITSFCILRKYSKQRVYEWIRKNDKFRDAYESLMTKQEDVLVKGGLKKQFSFPMCALLLSNNHGITLKTEQKITTDVTAKSFVDQVTDQSKDIVVVPTEVVSVEE